jgi:CheY-like chemotaxis protein
MQKDDPRGGTWWDDAASAAKNGDIRGDIRVLFIEDVPDEVELAVDQLQRNGIGCVHQRVETESQLRDALRDFRPDLILSDFRIPGFDGQSALRIAHDVAPDIPFIFLSGTIGEERAIQAMFSRTTSSVWRPRSGGRWNAPRSPLNGGDRISRLRD